MSGVYIGVDGKARKVKGGYIGIDGKARKIKKGYIGDENGVARLCYQSSIEWIKYDAIKKTGNFTKLESVPTESRYLYDALIYPNFTFDESNGYKGYGTPSTLATLKANAVWDYYVEEQHLASYPQTKLYYVAEYNELNNNPFKIVLQGIAIGSYIGGYKKGASPYCTFITDGDELPENGTVVDDC